jgi:general stress protein 26
MDEKELRAACLELMATASVVYMAGQKEDGYPRIRAFLNLRNREQYPNHVHLYEGHDEDFMIYLSTNTTSKKMADLRVNPRIGLYYCLPDEYFGLSLIGDVEIVDDMETKTALWADGWERYYPTTGKPDDPDYTVLRVYPHTAQGWYESRPFTFDIGG